MSFSLRLRLYRLVAGTLGLLALRLAFSERRWREGRADRLRLREFVSKPALHKRGWFHAASAGELESLWPVIIGWARDGRETLVTIFSDSAQGPLEKLRAALESEAPGAAHFLGYAPLEGDWEPYLRAARPAVFVSAKYEAWPDLWASLSVLGIPLAIVGARSRRSLRSCASLVRGMGLALPRIKFMTATEPDAERLRAEFPEASTLVTGEPRWDQVKARAARGNARARELTQCFSDFPRPWGILAQVWLSDLEAWDARLQLPTGTVWLVPHRVDEANVRVLNDFLRARGIEALRTSTLKSREPVRPSLAGPQGQPGYVLVDEMGFLLELYAHADWAFVGGGFGKVSMHSTIEPAIFGLPLSVGAKGQGKFPEIGELQARGQLTVFDSPEQIEGWVRQYALGSAEADSVQRRQLWKERNEASLGASQRVLQALI
ncbi:MAG: hypothetical protein NDJ90_00820 [Oligoflexia bacterium]|nr:hypothetical protein [Oligoflexia bacterium]